MSPLNDVVPAPEKALHMISNPNIGQAVKKGWLHVAVAVFLFFFGGTPKVMVSFVFVFLFYKSGGTFEKDTYVG